MDKKTNQYLLMMKELLKNTNETYFIELVGTPKSGKTTLLTHIEKLSQRTDFPVVARRETAEYNPVGKSQEQYNTWMVMELYKNLCEDMECNHGKIVVYDRGILDRLPWIKKDVEEGNTSREEAKILMEMYDLQVAKNYKPIVYNLITSPKLSILRKGKPGKFVNEESIGRLNKHIMESRDFFKQRSDIYREIKTDSYQGNLREFIVDIISSMTRDLKEQITRNPNYNIDNIELPNVENNDILERI